MDELYCSIQTVCIRHTFYVHQRYNKWMSFTVLYKLYVCIKDTFFVYQKGSISIAL